MARAPSVWLTEEEADEAFRGEDTTFDHDYELGHKIGDGGYSEVFHCRNRTTGIPAAVKIIEKTRLDDSGRRALREEVRVMKQVWLLPATWVCWLPSPRSRCVALLQLNHPNIVKMQHFYNERGARLFSGLRQCCVSCASLCPA